MFICVTTQIGAFTVLIQEALLCSLIPRPWTLHVGLIPCAGVPKHRAWLCPGAQNSTTNHEGAWSAGQWRQRPGVQVPHLATGACCQMSEEIGVICQLDFSWMCYMYQFSSVDNSLPTPFHAHIHMHVHAYTHTHTTHTRTYTHKHTHMHMHAHTHTIHNTHIHAHTNTNTNTNTRAHTDSLPPCWVECVAEDGLSQRYPSVRSRAGWPWLLQVLSADAQNDQ